MEQYRIPVPKSVLVQKGQDPLQRVAELSATEWVVKAQIHAGARALAGGVRIVDDRARLAELVSPLLDKRLVTRQTNASGQPVNEVLIEEKLQADTLYYLRFSVHRQSGRLAVSVSRFADLESDELYRDHSDEIYQVLADPVAGLLPFHRRELSYRLGMDKAHADRFAEIISRCYQLVIDYDVTLLEINPLALLTDDRFSVFDAKMIVDDNALFRQSALLEMHDRSQDDDKETYAQEHGFSYIKMEQGNIGCMVNGAGLAMATMDMIKIQGGEPANFLDIGGSSDTERIRLALDLLLSDAEVKLVFINIFGGIVRCDMVADGLLELAKTRPVNVPVVIRMTGTESALAWEKLQNTAMDIHLIEDLSSAVQQAVNLARSPV